MTKIAFLVTDDRISGHLGMAQEILFVELSETGNIVKQVKESFPFNGGRNRVNWIKEKEVSHIFMTGMGEKVANHFKTASIIVIDGNNLTIDSAIKQFNSKEFQVLSPDPVSNIRNNNLKLGQHSHHQGRGVDCSSHSNCKGHGNRKFKKVGNGCGSNKGHNQGNHRNQNHASNHSGRNRSFV